MMELGKRISPQNLQAEEKIFEDIKRCIDSKKYMLYDAGAGAGKTYDLTRSLKYIITQYGEELKIHNSKILCITYTNVAVEEVKERLGNTSLVDISTIHERIWEMIKQHQKELVKIHIEKLEDQKKSNEASLSEKWADHFRELPNEVVKLIQDEMFRWREEYYKHRNKKVADFRGALPEEIINIAVRHTKILSNVGNFKKFIENMYKAHDINNALMKIENNEEGFRRINYDARYNSDSLARMRISHDTLLEYGEKIIEENDLLKQIIINMYPYILVDEYQDTSKRVIRILEGVYKHTISTSHKIFIGYFGDSKQAIYDDGVSELENERFEVYKIQKIFNRRSSEKIIEIANQIRNDGLKQKSIYEDYTMGSVNFFKMKGINKEEVINQHKASWGIDNKDKLYCFELTNELVANQNGFKMFYDFFKELDDYKGHRYNQLNTEVMSQDLSKLGVIPRLLYNILNFRYLINQDTSMVIDIMPRQTLNQSGEINIVNFREVIERFKSINVGTLKDYVEELFKKNNEETPNLYNQCLNDIFSGEIDSYESFYNYLLNRCFKLDDDDSITRSKELLEKFLLMEFKEFESWYIYVSDIIGHDTIFYTLHSTKGRQFNNVIVFIRSRFGRDAEYFGRLFDSFGEDSEGDNSDKLEKARNLLYVAVTRAKYNLSIVYEDDIPEKTEEAIKKIFGDVKKSILCLNKNK